MNASTTAVHRGATAPVRFTVYADFNCPYCHALNELLHAMNLDNRVDFRSIRHAETASSDSTSVSELAQLTREVAQLRSRAPSVKVMVPLFRPDSSLAARLLLAVSTRSSSEAIQLRRRLFRALWVDGLDISSQAVLDSLLSELSIEAPVIAADIDQCLSDWQSEWDSAEDFEAAIPVVISDKGEKVIGFPPEAELNAFLQTGTRVSEEDLHELDQQKPLQRILVLDDDADSLRMLIEQMRNAQVEIVESFDDLVGVASHQDLPDLVVVNTSLVSDNELRHLWAQSSASDLDGAAPCVFISEDKSTEAEVAAFEAGAADFIARPFHPRVLQARLNLHLQARESQRQLKNIARIDGLTSIENRREFDIRLMSEWSRGARSKQPLALLMIDVDKFKQYNDHYGHLRGDECLIAVAQILKGCGHRAGDLIARYGGEEFVALLPNSDLNGAVTVAEECLAALAEAAIPHAKSDVAPVITASIGAASILPIHDNSCTILIEQADTALYQAKQGGRNRICKFVE